MDAFINVVSSVDLATKKEFLKHLQKIVTDETNELKSQARVADINNYVGYEDNFVIENSEELNNVLNDLNTLNLSSSSREGISKTWLTSTDQPYSWMSSTGPVVNHPKPLLKTPAIKTLLERINNEKGLELNSCLVSFYPSEKVSLSLHTDNECTMDQTQPICNLSIGSPRAIKFYRITQNHNDIPQETILMQSRSLCTMKPGCQSLFKHKVPQGTTPGHRFSLSFRRIKTSPPCNEQPMTLRPINITTQTNK